jgi:2-succinyl-5-enolpyruvyl-6-hydroxy-3-cyclohexene-1-carboxylate synthase
MNYQNITAIYVGAFVDELARAGLANAVVCPGSRSTPLAMTLADQASRPTPKASGSGGHPAIKIWMHYDERSAGFFALGMAKAAHKPVALVCTSGSAAANFFPAIVEAHYARVPLLVLTADRPPELRDFGAPQTIDQIKMYGRYAKWFVEMALPEASADVLRYVRTVAARAVAETLAAPAGVVHLNFPFREPLVPIVPDLTGLSDLSGLARAENQPYTRVASGARAILNDTEVRRLAEELGSMERGLIVVGMQEDGALPAAVARLSAVLGYPILADPLSQVRCGPHDRANVIDSYDAFLRDAATVERLAPEVVLRFGALPTSKPVLQYLQRYPNARQVLIDGGGLWPDAARVVSDVVHAEAAAFCDELAQHLNARRGGSEARPDETGWLDVWRDINHRARQAITTQILHFSDFFEGRVFTELAERLPDGATCFTSSSMPVRDCDTFFPGSRRAIRFLSNRGANGIDGVVSTALGASAAGAGPLALVIGDIALYHDLNGLLAARLHGLRATIILIHNDGGGIFSFLPQAAHPQHFEQLFGTPHGLDFCHAAEMYGASFRRAQTWDEFRSAVEAGLRGEGVSIVEVRTNRATNVTMHRQVWTTVAEALR